MSNREKEARYTNFLFFQLQKNGWYYAISTLFILAALAILFRIAFVNFVDKHELAYMFDRRTGELTLPGRTGYFVTWPLVMNVHTVDMRPGQVCISRNQRVLNCKLVKFNPAGLEEFVSWHGRRDYAWGQPGRTAYAGDGDDGTLTDIFGAYAYDGKNTNYSFMTILQELVPGETMATPSSGDRP